MNWIDSVFTLGILALIGLIYGIIWIIALVDMLKSSFKDQNMKLIWAVVLIFANPIGPIVYFILAKEQKNKPFEPDK
ncbi:PLDc N-terminal domain-containing protein [Shivajiella indica]|uniref:PLDc N-terminal domain-containing protein n=1 Tax=Shivajiella indica TaxID=872115 RepID=A0ABW5B542_9BACT